MTKIILLMGIGSTGKTTLANQLVKVLDEDYIIDGFDHASGQCQKRNVRHLLLLVHQQGLVLAVCRAPGCHWYPSADRPPLRPPGDRRRLADFHGVKRLLAADERP